MFLEAIKEFNLDAGSSILVGDKATDIQAGFAAGVGTNLYLGAADISQHISNESYIGVSSLSEVKNFLKDKL